MQQSVEMINWMNWLTADLNWMTMVIVLFVFNRANLMSKGKT